MAAAKGVQMLSDQGALHIIQFTLLQFIQTKNLHQSKLNKGCCDMLFVVTHEHYYEHPSY